MRRILIFVLCFFAAGHFNAIQEARAVAVGEKAPAFELKDTYDRVHSLEDYRGRTVVLEWTNPDCPFVKKHYDGGNMQALQKEMNQKGVVWLSIASSAHGLQGHYHQEEWNEILDQKNASPAALLLDVDGIVGRLYDAKTTPHMYVIDPEGNLVYKGAIDDKPSVDPSDIPGARNHVRRAVEESMAGQPVAVPSTKPYGCSVKYSS